MKDRPKIRLFNVINGILFILISIIMLIPIYKVLVDSFDLSSAYGMRLWPKQFGLAGYASVLSNPTLYLSLIHILQVLCIWVILLSLVRQRRFQNIQHTHTQKHYFMQMRRWQWARFRAHQIRHRDVHFTPDVSTAPSDAKQKCRRCEHFRVMNTMFTLRHVMVYQCNCIAIRWYQI